MNPKSIRVIDMLCTGLFVFRMTTLIGSFLDSAYKTIIKTTSYSILPSCASIPLSMDVRWTHKISIIGCRFDSIHTGSMRKRVITH